MFAAFSGLAPRLGKTACVRCVRFRTTFADSRKLRAYNKQPGKYIVLIIPATTFALGTWQVKRRTWKLNLIQELESRLTEAPVELPQDLQQLEDYEYRRVAVKGTFDHANEVYIGPRSRVSDDDKITSGLLSMPGSANTGVYVVTPFKLSDRDLTILVNRGWVNFKNMDPAKRAQANPTGEITLTGIVRKTENRSPLESDTKPDGRLFPRRDIDVIARSLNVVPVFIDACADSTVPGGPIGGQTRVRLWNEHLTYIFTWYTLTAFTMFMWYQKYWRRR